jgi:hypothetical protein
LLQDALLICDGTSTNPIGATCVLSTEKKNTVLSSPTVASVAASGERASERIGCAWGLQIRLRNSSHLDGL